MPVVLEGMGIFCFGAEPGLTCVLWEGRLTCYGPAEDARFVKSPFSITGPGARQGST